MASRIMGAFVAVLALSAVAHAEYDDPEYQLCTKWGADAHAFIDCLLNARDEWDRIANKRLSEVIEKVDESTRRALYTLVKKQREQRYTKCGPPNPLTIRGAECQRAMAMDQSAELDRYAAALSK